jgi:ankyrin repeat protein
MATASSARGVADASSAHAAADAASARAVAALALVLATRPADVSPTAACCRALWTDARVWRGLARVPRGQHRRTHLSCAARRGDAVRARFLLVDANAPVDALDATGRSALHYAANYHAGVSTDVLDALLAAGATVDAAATRDAMTPLHVAAARGDAVAARRLCAAGANASASALDGSGPLTAAASKGYDAVVETLLGGRGGARPDGEALQRALHAACACGKDGAARLLISAGAPVNGKTVADGATALHRAALRGHLGCVQVLLAAGAAVDAVADSGATPLFVASFAGATEVVRELLRARAGKDCMRVGTLARPIHAAAEQGHADVVRCLLAVDAAIDAVMADGRSALFVAAEAGRVDAMKALVCMGAKLMTPDGRNAREACRADLRSAVWPEGGP